MSEGADDEVLILSRQEGERIANAIRGQPDPLADEVSPSLLSAEHIKKYVLATGLISPFFEGGGGAARIKKASYEGRMGSRAFIYNDAGELVSLAFRNNALKIPHNSIVFVESDLDFRLPEYIALRFNLQIRHVHRGLLLGTGPLVDPGYWGKLCIPLHNLTDEDYVIPVEEGLIWIEFTRTTSKRGTDNPGRAPLERDRKEYWNIEDFIEKAARQYRADGSRVPIRSSIREAIEKANRASRHAEVASKDAERVNLLFTRIAWIGAAATVIAVLALWGTFWGSLSPRIDAARDSIDEVRSALAAEGNRAASQDVAIQELNEQLRQMGARIEALEEESRQLRSDNGRAGEQ